MKRFWGSQVTGVFIIAAILMFSVLTKVQGQNFTDVKTTDWYYQNVVDLVGDSRGIVQGYPDGSFKPGTKLSKDQFITMLVRAAGFEPGNASGYWAQNYINKALELGFIQSGEFSSYSGSITREEMSMMIVRAVTYLEGEPNLSNLTQVIQVVSDSSDFTYQYENYIMKTYKLGIITGYPDHSFKPQGVLTRAEASAVVIRLIQPSKRIAFDYDTLYAQMYSGIESHLLGGANWADPVKVSDKKNAEEDWGLITSDMGYSPTKYQVENNMVSQQSVDIVMGAIDYDENGAFAGHLEDFERLLLRRMPQDQADIVMDYLAKKINKYTYLEHDEAFFYLDKDRYLVRIDEVLAFKGTQYEQAMEVNFNIWYRDSNFINKYEEDITQIMPDTDVIINR